MGVAIQFVTDEYGHTTYDFKLGVSPEDDTLPVRAGVWYLDEMSEPDRFSYEDGDALRCEDAASLVSSKHWIISTVNDRRNNYIPQVSGTEETFQRAMLALMTQRGTIPQLAETGNYHAELLTGQIDFAEYNSTLISNIRDLANTLTWSPSYSVVDGKVEVNLEAS